jgi:hypothetical protein
LLLVQPLPAKVLKLAVGYAVIHASAGQLMSCEP